MKNSVESQPSSEAGTKKGTLDTLIGLLLRQPLLVFLVFLVLSAVLGWQASNFRIDASPDTLLTQDNALYLQTQEVNARYAPQEFLLITYEPPPGELFTESTYAALQALSEQLLTLERVESVRSILNVPLFSGVDGIGELGDDLSQLTLQSGNYSQEQIEAEFAAHPVYENLLVNEQQSATALQVLFRSDPALDEINAQILELQLAAREGAPGREQEAQLERLQLRADPLEQALASQRRAEVEQIREIVADHAGQAEIHMGGIHVLAYQLIEIISKDLLVFGIAIAGMICLLLLTLFRGLRWLLIPVICCSFSVLCTTGLFALLDIRVTVISSNFIALQLILTLAIVIHLIVQYREYHAQQPDSDQRTLLARTLHEKLGPCFFAAITTSVGFASLISSGIQPVIAFGWMMVIAMSFATAVSLILFPVLMLLFPRGEVHEDPVLVSGLTRIASRLVLSRGNWMLALAVLLVLAGIAGSFRLSVENSFINYFRQSTQAWQELAYIDREFGGSTPLDITYRLESTAGNPDIVLTADSVLRMQQIQARLDALEATGRILSPVNITDLARAVNNDAPLTEYELTALYWMIDAELRDDLISAFYDREREEVRFNVWIQDLSPGLNRAELLAGIRAEMQALDIPEASYTLSNLFMLYQDIMQRLFESQILTLGLVYLALVLTFLLLFRSLRLALIAIVPNLLATAVIFGTMGWLGIALDLMTITIAAVVMGIAVDDTIHYIHRYRHELARNTPEEAVRNTHASVGTALIYTTLIIALGFAMLAFSDFVPSILFGLLTALAMITALLACLCVLPVLLKRFATSS